MVSQISTGLPGLDRVIGGLIPGDNVVWQVNSIEDYLPFLPAYCESAQRAGQKLIYFRFARHKPLLTEDSGAEIHCLHPEDNFETFLAEIHATIERTGRGAFYVFDCLSDLAVDWYSDEMLSNFFMLTCPYLYDLETIAYFALLRDYHSDYAVKPIAETTQLFLDVYRHKGELYIHPLKVQQRYSPTMYMLHVWEGDAFPVVTESFTIAEILAVPQPSRKRSGYQLNLWDRTFLEAEETEEATQHGDGSPDEAWQCFQHLLRMAISRDTRILDLAGKYLSISDVLAIRKRMIGTGLIGGKSVGMLLARGILKKTGPRWENLLEVHDSFYIASDVFYTFLVRNGVWWIRQRQRDSAHFLEGAAQARQRILQGVFPAHIIRQFEDMLNYFGQSPIIVRSSSLLEDNFGNSFAGKYESVFCANQGPHQKRLDDFISAVRTIYASTMSEKALSYRAQRGILDRDEQMSLLVQRVSGALYGRLFFPQIAGVGFSFNPYVWNEQIDPKAGVIRLVFGLGTRAVDRSDDDYTRVVALNAPDRRPETNFDKVRQYAQRKVDVLDLEANQLVARDFEDVGRESPRLPLNLFASEDEVVARIASETGRRDLFPWILTFDNLLAKSRFVEDAREMLEILHAAYDYPVDVEFTANFIDDASYKINVVQCRPLQIRGAGVSTEVSADVRPEDRVLEAHGAVIGQSRLSRIDRVIYVVPSVYGQMPVNERYAVARLVGRVAHLPFRVASGAPGTPADRPATIMLLGPGRWGTTTPSLGVPVSYAEINSISILCEIVAMREDLVPDVSLGTHFFSEMVEMDVLYLALFPNKEDSYLSTAFFEESPNRLTELLPDAERYANVLRVIDTPSRGGDKAAANGAVLELNADTFKQQVVCYLRREE